MKHIYEYMQLSLLGLFFLTVGPLNSLAFVGLTSLIIHCIVTQLHLVSKESKKDSSKFNMFVVAHYLTIYLCYGCAIAQYFVELSNAI